MESDMVGFRFHPTGEELINYYLKNKILGKSWLIDDVINEINICNYDPEILPYLSKIKSKDPKWYFFSPVEYTTSSKKAIKRTTPSGFWKATGNDRIIKDKRGHGVEIGIKKTLVYRNGRLPNNVSTPWVIHEYHISRLPLRKDLSQMTYVICQVMYKGEDADKFLVNYSNEPSHSLVSDPTRVTNTASEINQPVQGDLDGVSLNDLQILLNKQNELSPDIGFSPNTFLGELNNHDNPDLQPQSPYNDEDWNTLLSFNGGDFENMLCNQEIMMLTNLSNHGPRRPLSGIIVDSSISDNDSDAETISVMSYQGTSSEGSSNRHFPSSSITDSCKDLQTSADPSTDRKNQKSQLTRRTEMKKGKSKVVDASMDKELPSTVKTKKDWFIIEEAMKRNREDPPFIYLMNMIIGFILLLALISDIISVLVSVKT